MQLCWKHTPTDDAVSGLVMWPGTYVAMRGKHAKGHCKFEADPNPAAALDAVLNRLTSFEAPLAPSGALTASTHIREAHT